MNTSTIVQKLWNYCNVLRDAGPRHHCGLQGVTGWRVFELGHHMTRRHPLRGRIPTSWGPCSARRVASIFYGDYVEQLTYLLFLKMADERTKAPYNQENPVPHKWSWPELVKKDGEELFEHYRHTLEALGNKPGLLGLIFNKSQNKFQDPAKLRRLIVDLIDKGEARSAERVSMSADVKGDAYEGLLEKNAQDTKSGAGQYFTPRPLIHRFQLAATKGFN